MEFLFVERGLLPVTQLQRQCLQPKPRTTPTGQGLPAGSPGPDREHKGEATTHLGRLPLTSLTGTPEVSEPTPRTSLLDVESLPRRQRAEGNGQSRSGSVETLFRQGQVGGQGRGVKLRGSETLLPTFIGNLTLRVER